MKGKKITDKTILELGLGGLSTGFGGILTDPIQSYEKRVVINTVGKNFVVDTAFTPDTGLFETGISYDKLNNGRWIIVDEYETKEKAKITHEKWVEYMQKNPTTLTDIHLDKTFIRLNF